VLVLIDEPAFAGCKLTCRVVGLIEGEQSDEKTTERKDRVIAVEKENHSYARVKQMDDLGKSFEKELEEFFANYHQLSGRTYNILAVKGPNAALGAIKKACREVQRY
jgi:inorganic pyrophosphatase